MLTGPPPKFHGTWDILFYRLGGAFVVAHISDDGEGRLVITQSGTLSIAAGTVVTRQGASGPLV